jgi:hypothetical protein
MSPAVISLGLRFLAFAFVVSPVVAGPVSADPFGAGTASGVFTFADFCRENPTLNQPVGADPVWVEWLVAEGATAPDQPTPAMLQSGRLVRQVTRLNRCASTEQWQQVDRAPDGRPLEAPQRVGSALFTRLLPTKDPRQIELRFSSDWVRPSGWINNAQGLPEAICERSGVNSNLTVVPEVWIKVGETSSERATKTVDGKATAEKISRSFYLRVVMKPGALSVTQ